jgi:hypothetical protein
MGGGGVASPSAVTIVPPGFGLLLTAYLSHEAA